MKRLWAGMLAAILTTGCDMSSSTQKKMIIVGMDGLDPRLLQKYMDAGNMPNFKKMSQSGSFKSIETSNPPQSPVAWSSLMSGVNPGHHDVFDFIVREPGTYRPDLGMTEKPKPEPWYKKIFRLTPAPQWANRRKAPAAWDRLSDSGIPSVILRCPVTFPASPLKGKLLTGMGTPDLRGTQGMYTYFTTGSDIPKDSRGRNVKVEWLNDSIQTELTGPVITTSDGRKDTTLALTLRKLGPQQIDLKLGTHDLKLHVGEWSPWLRVEFPINAVMKAKGMVRVHLRSVEPVLGLYVTAVNIDPRDPAFPISYPSGYSKELAEKASDYSTLGMPYDTWALNEDRLSEKEFLDSAYSFLEEQEKSLNYELARFKNGFLFVYFGTPDLISHMFWRYEDPGHPNRGQSTDAAIREAIPRIYQRMDKVLGNIIEQAGPDTAVVVVSDHGFGSFRRAVHVNSWLRDNGFLTLKEGFKDSGDFFENVDWGATRAYSLGFGGIYINQFHREPEGVVYAGAEADQLKKELRESLAKWKDKDGSAITKRVYDHSEIYQGPFAERGPDLFIGFNQPFRASWQSALGGIPLHQVEDNMRAWSGDHLCDPDLVPGVVLANRPMTKDHPVLSDIAATVCHYFGVDASDIEGRPLF